jgi:DNA topoisomerase IA
VIGVGAAVALAIVSTELGQEAGQIHRVKTPTLAIVCKRELEIRNFVPVAYFEVVAIAVGMPVTEHPPHRTGRAAFPHPAPTFDV